MDRERPTQEQISQVDNWILVLSKTGIVTEMEPILLRNVLSEFGANFEISEEAKASLEKYSNADRRPGMNAVWGEERVKNYRIWLKHWVADYEQKTNKPLPVLVGTDIKTSGGLKFFTDLTVFASGLMTFKEYKDLTEDRARKGELWQAKKPEEEPTPSPHSSFPPDFPLEAWNYIQKTR